MLHEHAVGDPIIEFGGASAAIRKTTDQDESQPNINPF
jgi:hypothetical protein